MYRSRSYIYEFEKHDIRVTRHREDRRPHASDAELAAARAVSPIPHGLDKNSGEGI